MLDLQPGATRHTHPGRLTIVGHRGAAGLAPENTVAAFRRAADLGVRLLELDVRLTADRVPVCFHDDRLDRVTPASGRVEEWSWEALSRLPVMPGAFGGTYPDARIPRLDEALRSVPDACRWLVELKPSEDGAALVGRTLAVLVETGVLRRCRIISFDHELLVRIAEARPDVALGVLINARERDVLLPRAGALRAAAVHPPAAIVDEALVEAAHAAGFRVNAWTVNNAVEVRRFAALGVDEVTTDFPDVALAAAAEGA